MSLFNSILNLTGSIFSDKEVAIYKDTTEVLAGTLFNYSSILSCSVNDDSRLCEHPVESGVVITDHKVRNPIEINIRLSLPSSKWNSIYKELKQLYEESPYLRIKTKTDWYSNMVLVGIPHEETPESFDRIVFDLNFKEVKEVSPQFVALSLSSVKSAYASSTVKLGENNSVVSKSKSILKGWLS